MKAIRYFTAAAALVALAACNNEDLGGFNTDPNAVQIIAGVGAPFTRSNPAGTTEADRMKFNAGDRISVKAEGQDAVTYTLGVEDAVWTPDAGKYLKWNADSETFSAYYPADSYDGTQTTVPADQHEEGHIAQADYMKCEGVVRYKSEGAVSLTLSRQTARVAISEIRWEEQYGTDMQHIFSIALCDGVSGDIKPYKAGSGTYYALLMPGNGAADETFIKITVWDGNTEDSKQDLIVKGIPALEAGKSYECSLTLGKKVLAISSVTVMDWISSVFGDDENMTEEVITHEYVDLGLTSGTLWATCNVGATAPEECGDYFAWAETQSKETYDWSNEGNYKYGIRDTNDKTDGGMTKYNSTDNLRTLELSDDAASVNWGSNWRTPTKADFDELIEACETQWTDDYNDTGVAGLVITSKTDKTRFIFLPAAGYHHNYGLDAQGTDCKYWCSSIYETEYPVAWSLNVANDYPLTIGGNSRYYGFSVRAVYTPAN